MLLGAVGLYAILLHARNILIMAGIGLACGRAAQGMSSEVDIGHVMAAMFGLFMFMSYPWGAS